MGYGLRTLAAVVWVGALLLFGCERQSLDLSSARPYEVVTERPLETSNDRTAWEWQIVSEASSFEERGQTLARAALDLHAASGADLSMVSLVPSSRLADSFMKYGYGYFARDGRAGQGLMGADPDYHARWRIYSSEGVLSEREVSIAQLWKSLSPEFPSRNLLSSTLVDVEALRRRISTELGMPYEEVQLPKVRLQLWLEALD